MALTTLCPVLVGRAAELDALRAALRAAVAGEGGAVAISGDAGIGKSRLVNEIAAEAAAAGIPVLRGSAPEVGPAVPFLPFIEAVRVGRRSTGGEALEPAVRALLADGSEGSADPTVRWATIFDAVGRSLEDLAVGRGAILILEDLHWSDGGTLDLLDFLVRTIRGTRILMITTYRAENGNRANQANRLPAQVRGWMRQGLATQIELQPLDRDGVSEMLRATVGAVDGDLADRLYGRCEGNPYVLEEFLKAGALEAPDAAVPATVRDVIQHRVDHLGPRATDVLRAAAVVGDVLDVGLLADVVGHDVSDVLDALVGEQLLRIDRTGTYAWRHALTREVLEGSIPPARLRALHASVAEALMRRPSEDDFAIFGHLAAAGRWVDALPRSRRAADAATAIGAFADAARLLAAGLPHVDAPADRASTLIDLAELLVQAGRPDEGEAMAREALELSRRDAGAGLDPRAARTLAGCLWQQARWVEAIALEDQAIATLEAAGPSPDLVAALARRASWATLGEAAMGHARALIDRARALAHEHGYDKRLYRSDEGQVISCGDAIDAGLEIMDEGWRSRLRNDGRRGLDWREGKFMLHHAVAFRNILGRTRESLALLAEWPTSPIGQDAADTSLAVVWAEALWAHGEVAAAGRVLAAIDPGRIERNVVPWAQSVRADILAAREGARAAASAARVAIPRHWQPISQLRVAGLIHILVDAGDLAGAQELCERLDALLPYAVELWLPAMDAAVETHVAAGRPEQARVLAERAQAARRDDPLRLRIEARVQLAAGDVASALDGFAAAAAGFVRTGHRQDEWRTRRLTGRAMEKLGQHQGARAELASLDHEIRTANGLGENADSPRLDLSPRERDVVRLVGQGLRNREIADRLFLSERTVENHIHRVLLRSGLRSRVELAARVVAQAPD